MGRSSVFSLEQIYRKQLTQTWSKIPEAFRYVNSLSAPAGTDFGYFAGGNSPGTTTIDRIDYSNDTATASTKGNLSANGYFKAAAGNLSYGWWGGFGVSSGGPSTSIVNRVD